MVPVETDSSCHRREFETMARRRFQNPTPKRIGNRWSILVWEDHTTNEGRRRKRKRVDLGPAELSFREAQKVAAELMRPLNQGLVTPGSAVTFNEFVESVYRPTVLPLFARSTQERYKSVITNHLDPQFRTVCLRQMSPLSLQQFLSSLAGSKLAHESRDKVRDVLASILTSAMRFGFLVNNPIEGLRLPPAKTGKRIKPYLTPDQFEQFLGLIREPYATMVFVAVYTGLRPSELFGLRWSDIHADSITIDERYCRGDWGAPKSVASNATVAVNRLVIQRILGLKLLSVAVQAGRATRRYRAVRSDGPDDLVFQSFTKDTPVRDNNVLVRHIKPAARKLGLGWVNWQVLRRSFATWLKMAGADVKDAQALMRHSRASTTLDIYQQFVPESQRRAVDRLGTLVQ